MQQLAAAGAAAVAHQPREHVGSDDAGGHRVLEVVADVGDPVGPADDLALGSPRRRARPRVVADPVERLGAQVQGFQYDIGAPDGVVEPADVGSSASSLACPPGPCPQS